MLLLKPVVSQLLAAPKSNRAASLHETVISDHGCGEPAHMACYCDGHRGRMGTQPYGWRPTHSIMMMPQPRAQQQGEHQQGKLKDKQRGHRRQQQLGVQQQSQGSHLREQCLQQHHHHPARPARQWTSCPSRALRAYIQRKNASCRSWWRDFWTLCTGWGWCSSPPETPHPVTNWRDYASTRDSTLISSTLAAKRSAGWLPAAVAPSKMESLLWTCGLLGTVNHPGGGNVVSQRLLSKSKSKSKVLFVPPATLVKS